MPRGKYKPNPERVERNRRIVELCQAGVTQAEAAAELGLSKYTLYNVARKAGLSWPSMQKASNLDGHRPHFGPHSNKYKAERNAEVVRLRIVEGMTYEQIAQCIGTSRQRIEQILYEEGYARTNRIAICAQKLYVYIVAYKATHDGNSPSVSEMVDHATHTMPRMNAQLAYLEKQGKIRIFHTPHGYGRVEVVGGCWIPPKNGDGAQ